MGIFADKVKLFTAYRVRCRNRYRTLGGIPNDSETIERWIRARTGVTDDEELKRMTITTLLDLGVDMDESQVEALRAGDLSSVSWEELHAASGKVASEWKCQSFKRNERGVLCLEARQIKAGLKEATNALFAKEKWGPTRKGPKNFVAEHVFVEPRLIPFANGITKPSGIELVIGHVSGPGGPRSTLNYHEYVENTEYEFVLLMDKLAQSSIEFEKWMEVWVLMEQLGTGATRSQMFGQFDVIEYELLPDYVVGDIYEETPEDAEYEEPDSTRPSIEVKPKKQADRAATK